VRTRVYAADGTKIATVFEENRKEISVDKVAPVMQEAVVAIEDSRFYEHNGFDPRGFMRAAVTNVTAGGVAQGGGGGDTALFKPTACQPKPDCR